MSFFSFLRRLFTDTEYQAFRKRLMSGNEVEVDRVLDTAPVAFVSIDANSTILSWNREAERMFGVSRRDALGANLTQLIIPPAFRARHTQGIRHFLKTGEGPVLNKPVEVTALHKNGKEFPIALTISAEKVGDSWQFFAYIEDISAKRQAEQTQDYIASIIEYLQDAIYTVSTEGIIQTWNPAAEAIYGYRASEAVGQPVSVLHPEGHTDEEDLFIRKVFRGDIVGPFETERETKLGERLTVSLLISPIKNDLKEIIGASIVARDVSEKTKLAETRSLLAAIVESSQDAIYSKTPEGEVLTWNRGAQKLYGYFDFELIGENVSLLLPEGLEDEETHILRTISKGYTLDDFRTRRITKDGRVLEIVKTAAPILDDAGKVVGVAVIDRDVTPEDTVAPVVAD